MSDAMWKGVYRGDGALASVARRPPSWLAPVMEVVLEGDQEDQCSTDQEQSGGRDQLHIAGFLIETPSPGLLPC